MTTIEQRRGYQRKYRERNLEARREDNRIRLAKYREKNAHLSILESVTNVDAFWSRVGILNEQQCWEWSGAKTDRGYGVYAPLPGVLLRAHRVAYALHNNSIDDDLFVCHTCDNPSCCNPSHLFLGTPKDNNDDKIAKGRHNPIKGESNPQAKLTAEKARAIYLDGKTNREIGQAYGVSPSLASMIRKRVIWAEATLDLPDLPHRKSGAGSSAYRKKEQT
jgi:hypothetical protein